MVEAQFSDTASIGISQLTENQFPVCTTHQEEAKAFCTSCNKLLCVFCMMKDEDDADDHVHKPVNNKTYCSKAKTQWIELKKKSVILETLYKDKVQELGSLCAELFNSQGGNDQNDGVKIPGDEDKKKAQAVDSFCNDVNICLEKADALQTEARADLMTELAKNLPIYENKLHDLTKMVASMEMQKVIEEQFQSKDSRKAEESAIKLETDQTNVNQYLLMKVHALEDRSTDKLSKIEKIIQEATQKMTDESTKLQAFIKEESEKQGKKNKEMKLEMRAIQESMKNWSTHILFFRMLFDLNLNKRVIVEERFVKRLFKEKVSNNVIYSLDKLTADRIIVDANNKACILDMNTFDFVTGLEPSDHQLTNVKVLGDKIICHFGSMFNISYQLSGKNYQLANTDTNNWMYCMCIADEHHVIQGSNGGLLYVFNTQQINYFLQKQCFAVPGGYAIHQVIKLKDTQKYAVGTWGNGLHIVDINLTTYEHSRDGHFYMQGKYITDIVEVSKNIIVVASYSDCSYFKINLETKEETLLGKGFSPYSMGLCLFPDFDYDNFPFVLAKEDDWISVINVQSGFVYRLTSCSTHNQNYLNQRIFFQNSNTFVTDEGSYSLSKFEISDEMMKNLKEMNGFYKALM